MKLGSSLCLALAVAAVATGCLPSSYTKTPELERAARERRREEELALLTRPHPALAVAQDAVARVVGPEMTCSGTIIRNDLVLTAHHCLVKRGPHGEFTSTVVAPEKVVVELGGDYIPWGTTHVKAIVAPPCGEAGGKGDLAVLVLVKELPPGIPTFTPRLDAPPERGELLVPMGFGHCATSPDGIRRRKRDGGSVTNVSWGTFEMTASICPGDSGGPMLAKGSEVVGVVSLSAMDNDERTRAQSIMARIDAFRSVFVYARAIADGADGADLPPLSCD